MERNRKVTLEILESSESSGEHVFYNVRVVKVEEQTERQRMNFYRKMGRLCSTSNISNPTHLTQTIEAFLRGMSAELKEA